MGRPKIVEKTENFDHLRGVIRGFSYENQPHSDHVLPSDRERPQKWALVQLVVVVVKAHASLYRGHASCMLFKTGGLGEKMREERIEGRRMAWKFSTKTVCMKPCVYLFRCLAGWETVLECMVVETRDL